MIWRDTIISWKGVEPKHSVFNHVNQHESGDIFEGHGAVSGTGAFFYGTDASFDVGDMLISSSCVEHWKMGTDGLEFMVSKDSGHRKSSLAIDFYDALGFLNNSGDVPVRQSFDSDKLQIAGDGDEERNFVDKHDVNTQRDVGMIRLDVRRYRIKISEYVVRHGPDRFSFQIA